MIEKGSSPFIAFTDGGARVSNPGVAACAYLINTPEGTRLDQGCKTLGIQSNNVAEYQGLIAALRSALNRKITRLLVKSDSKLMVKQMTNEWRVKHHDMQMLWAEAQNLVDELESFQIIHIPREQNAEADKIYNDCLDVHMGRTKRA